MPVESTLQSLRSWMVSSCETLAIILNQGVYPEEARHELLSAEDIGYKSWSGVAFPVSLFGGVEGEFSLLLDRQRAATLIDLLVGGSGGEASEEFTALHQSVLQEAIQQLVGGLSDMLSQLRGQPVKVRLAHSATEGLREACLDALKLDRRNVRAFAEGFSWRACAEDFVRNLQPYPEPEKSRFWRRLRRLARLRRPRPVEPEL